MTDFAALTTPRPLENGRFSLEVPDGWQQGRGAFGGFGLAALIRAMEASRSGEDAAERPLRTLTAELCAPLMVGPAEVSVEVLRRGSGMTTVASRITQDGAVAAHAVGIFARSRDDASYSSLKRPALVPSDGMGPSPSNPPRFTQFFEYKIVGAAPFSGAAEARVENWIRLRSAPPRVDAAYVAALSDATWPALFSTLTSPRLMSTVSFTLQLFGPFDDLDPAAPYYHRSAALAATGGFSAEMREVWSAEGRLLSLNHQTFATIR